MWFPKYMYIYMKVGAEGVVAEEGCEFGTRLDGFACLCHKFICILYAAVYQPPPLLASRTWQAPMLSVANTFSCLWQCLCVCVYVCTCTPVIWRQFFLQSQALQEDTSTETHTSIPLKTSPCYPHTYIIYLHPRLAHTRAHTEFCTRWPGQDFRQLTSVFLLCPMP